jgi:hypothetical protein
MLLIAVTSIAACGRDRSDSIDDQAEARNAAPPTTPGSTTVTVTRPQPVITPPPTTAENAKNLRHAVKFNVRPDGTINQQEVILGYEELRDSFSNRLVITSAVVGALVAVGFGARHAFRGRLKKPLKEMIDRRLVTQQFQLAIAGALCGGFLGALAGMGLPKSVFPPPPTLAAHASTPKTAGLITGTQQNWENKTSER